MKFNRKYIWLISAVVMALSVKARTKEIVHDAETYLPVPIAVIYAAGGGRISEQRVIINSAL